MQADGTKLQTWILGKCLGILRRYLVYILRQPMSTTLPGIFSFRAKMAKIFGLNLALPAVKIDAPSLLREGTTHTCADGQNKADDDYDDD